MEPKKISEHQLCHNEPKKFTTISTAVPFTSFFSFFSLKNLADTQTIKVQVHILETFVGVTFSLVVGSHKQKQKTKVMCL